MLPNAGFIAQRYHIGKIERIASEEERISSKFMPILVNGLSPTLDH